MICPNCVRDFDGLPRPARSTFAHQRLPNRSPNRSIPQPSFFASLYLTSAEVQAVPRCSKRTLIRYYQGYKKPNGVYVRPVLGVFHRGRNVLFARSEVQRFITARTTVIR